MVHKVPVVPPGWISSGDAPECYEAGLDYNIFHSGSASGYLKSVVRVSRGFGTLMQQCAPGFYAGKRVMISAFIKTKAVAGWAGLWMRVDGEDGKEIGFDNMCDRPIKGTTDWAKYAVVLDVPDRSTALAFGVLLFGKGMMWVDDIVLDVADKDTPLTGRPFVHQAMPVNLNFEE